MSETDAQRLSDLFSPSGLDIRMVLGLAGDRALSAREEVLLQTLKAERGENLFSDMMYALTHQTFPARQARNLWGEILEHRRQLADGLGRDPGLSVSTHDYLTNRLGVLKHISLIEEAKLASLAAVATHDGLTGLLDKTSFLRRLQDELNRSYRYGGDLSLVMVDIDHFKALNDTHGHADGDVVLADVAKLIRQEARSTDVAGRYGGEEFGVILVGVNAAAGQIFAERLRQSVEQEFAETCYDVTISAGVAEAPHARGGEEPEAPLTADGLLRRADAALYQAKANGRNCVC